MCSSRPCLVVRHQSRDWQVQVRQDMRREISQLSLTVQSECTCQLSSKLSSLRIFIQCVGVPRLEHHQRPLPSAANQILQTQLTEMVAVESFVLERFISWKQLIYTDIVYRYLL